MTRKSFFIMLGLALFAAPVSVQAGLTDNLNRTGLINKIKFTNYEAFIRENANAPEKYVLVSPNAVEDGDHLLSIFSASELTIQRSENSGVFGPAPAWQKGDDGRYFLGYSLAKITKVGGQFGTDLDYSNPNFDPYGLLDPARNEMVALFDAENDWSITGDVDTDVINSFLNNPVSQWATFGITDPATNGGGFNRLPMIFGTLIGVSTVGLNAIDVPTGLTFDRDKAFGNDVFAGSNIYTPGANEWSARSEDPLTFAVVPEPGTLALWGGCLAIVAVMALRRRNN